MKTAQKEIAELLEVSGRRSQIKPANGRSFSLKEAQTYVGGYVEVINLRDGRILLINENGKGNCEKNKSATAAFAQFLFAGDWLAGDVILCPDSFFR